MTRPFAPVAAGAAAVALLLSACASDPATSTAATPTPAATASAAVASSTGASSLVSPAASPSGQLSFTPSEPAPGRTVVVTVTGRTVSPAPATVDVRAGAPVRLTVTSDATNQLHVHGLDLEKPLVAGQPLTLDLSFPDPGVYEVETHEPSLLLLRFAVR